MSILNEQYVFEIQAPPDARAAFKSPPRKTLFHTTTEFLRLITTENMKTGERGNEIFRSPWWISKEAFRELAKRSTPDFPIGSVARIRLAVPESFNSKMECVATIYLTQPAYGWVGPAQRQLATSKSSIYFAGGEEQVFLPNLSDSTGMASEYARLRSFTWLAP